MDTEDLEMHDMTKERQEEEREEGEKEETNLDWDSFDNNLEDFSDNTSQYGGNLPDLPSTSYERPELDKNIALEMFIRKNLDESFEIDPYDDNVLELRNRTSDSPSGISFKPIGKTCDYI